MRSATWVLAGVLAAACGGAELPAEAGGGEPVTAERSLPLLWTGTGVSPKLAIGWLVVPGDSFDFHEQLTAVNATDHVALPPVADLVPPPSTHLVPDLEAGTLYSFGLLLAVDDLDGDGSFTWDGLEVVGPDVTVGVARHHLVLYVEADPLAPAPPAIAPGFHLFTLDLCGAGGLVEIPLNGLFALETAATASVQDVLGDLCGGVATAGTGTGPCSANPGSAECVTCGDAELDRCFTGTCDAAYVALDTCVTAHSCVAADGAWEESCVLVECTDAWWAFDDCMWSCFDPYACY